VARRIASSPTASAALDARRGNARLRGTGAMAARLLRVLISDLLFPDHPTAPARAFAAKDRAALVPFCGGRGRAGVDGNVEFTTARHASCGQHVASDLLERYAVLTRGTSRSGKSKAAVMRCSLHVWRRSRSSTLQCALMRSAPARRAGALRWTSPLQSCRSVGAARIPAMSADPFPAA
jgi:hypothetical protein